MYFNVPICTSPAVKWPSRNPFVGRSNLVMCIENGAIYPFLDVKLKLANGLTQKINDRYGSKLNTQIKYMNTSKLGFLTTMKNAVDSGECDVISTNVQILEERKKIIHYQCNWGTTSIAFLRSGRDSSIPLKTLQDLNKTSIIVGAYSGTTYETIYVKQNLQAAQYIPFSTADIQYQKVLNNEVHAVIGDAVTFLVWLNANKANCTGCEVNFIGDPYGFSTFTTLNITSTGSSTIMMKTNHLNNVLFGIVFLASTIIMMLF